MVNHAQRGVFIEISCTGAEEIRSVYLTAGGAGGAVRQARYGGAFGAGEDIFGAFALRYSLRRRLWRGRRGDCKSFRRRIGDAHRGRSGVGGEVHSHNHRGLGVRTLFRPLSAALVPHGRRLRRYP